MKNVRNYTIIILIFFATIFCCSCSCSCSSCGIGVVPVTGITLSHENIEVSKDTNFTLTFTVSPSSATTPGAYISIANTDVVTTTATTSNLNSDTITFSAVGDGSTKITFRSVDGNFQKECNVVVYNTRPLAVPQNIIFDGEKVSWDSVTKDTSGQNKLVTEEKYQISITGADNQEKIFVITNAHSFAGNAEFSFNNNETYSIKVKAKGDANSVKNGDSEYSSLYKFCQLSTPQINIVDGVLTITRNEINTTHFIIQYNSYGAFAVVPIASGSVSKEVLLDDFKVNNQIVNDYTIKVISVKAQNEEELASIINASSVYHSSLNSIDYVSSPATEIKSVHRIEKPHTLTFSNSIKATKTLNNVAVSAYNNTKLTWGAETNTYLSYITYKIKITNSTTNRNITIDSTATNSLLITESMLESISQSGINNFEITIIGQHNADLGDKYINSETSEKYYFSYMKVSQSNFNLNTSNAGVLSFIPILYNSNHCFEKYQFVFVSGSSYKQIETLSDNINLVDFLQNAGTYNLYIYAVGNNSSVQNNLGFINVSTNTNVSFSTINAPTNLAINALGDISWSASDSAVNYNVELKITKDSVDSSYHYETTSLSCNITDLLTGITYADLETTNVTYSLKVTAISSTMLNSASNSINFTILPKISINSLITNGVISWSKVSGAGLYKIKLNNSEWFTIFNGNQTSLNIYETDSLSNFVVTGENTITMFAYGINETHVLNSATSSISVMKLSAPIISNLQNQVLSWDSTIASGINYNLYIYKGDSLLRQVSLSETSYSLSTISNTDLLTIKIEKTNVNSLTSDLSEPFYVQKLTTNSLSVERINNQYYLVFDDNNKADIIRLTGSFETDLAVLSNKSIYYNIVKENKWAYSLSNFGSLSVGVKTMNIENIVSQTYLANTSSVLNNNTISSPAYISSAKTSISIVKLPYYNFEIASSKVAVNFEYDSSNNLGIYKSKISSVDINLYKDGNEESCYSSSLDFSANILSMETLDAGSYLIKLQAKGNLSGVDGIYLLDSEITEYTVIKLSPVTLSASGNTLSFNRTVAGVANDDATLLIDNYAVYAGDTLLSLNTDYTMSIESGIVYITLTSSRADTKTVKIKSMRDGYISSNLSNGISVRVVGAINFVKNNNKLEWSGAIVEDNIDLVTSYSITSTSNVPEFSFNMEISANDSSYYSNGVYSINLPSIESAGEYSFSIRVLGGINGSIAYIGSNDSVSLTIIQLNSATTSTAIVQNGKLKIENYLPASENSLDKPQGIKIEFHKDNGLGVYELVASKTKTYGVESNYSGAGFTFDLSEILEAGRYKIFIEYLVDNSISSLIQAHTYLIATDNVLASSDSGFVKLNSTRIYIENGKIYWDEVAGANYNLYNGNELIGNNLTTTTTDEVFAVGENLLKVQVVKDGALCSAMSATFTAIKLSQPTSLTISNSVLSWLTLEGVSNYLIYQDEITNLINTQSSTSFILPVNLQKGAHSFYIKALGTISSKVGEYALSGYLDSELEAIGKTINYINSTTASIIENGILKWDSVAGINTYIINIYNFSDYDFINLEDNADNILHTLSTAETSYDLSNLITTNGNYVVEVYLVANNSTHIISTNSPTIYNRTFMNIDVLEGLPIYDNLRMENGQLAYSISRTYWDNYISRLTAINSSNSSFYSSSCTFDNFKSVVNKSNINESLKEISYSLVNFNISINGIVSSSTYSGFNIEANSITLYYNLDSKPAGEYTISLKPLGNSTSVDLGAIVGVIIGQTTQFSETIYKLTSPTCPILSSANSIEGGKLIWQNIAGYSGKYVIEFRNTETNIIETREISVSSVIEESSLTVAKLKANNICELNLYNYITNGDLITGINYQITIFASSGKFDSKEYIKGVSITTDDLFFVLPTIENLSVQNGQISWGEVANASKYNLKFYKYESGAYLESPIVIQTETTTFNPVENSSLEEGIYKITLTSIGNGNNILSSVESNAKYVVKAGTTNYSVDSGILRFDIINYYNVDSLGVVSSDLSSVLNYKIQIVEHINDGDSYSELYTESNCVLNGNYYYFDLPDSFNGLNAYSIKVCGFGNSVNLLSGDFVESNSYYRSLTPEQFNIDANGELDWTATDARYVLYVSSGSGYNILNVSGADYITNNAYNINSSGLSAGKYSFYLRALHNNSSSDIKLRSAKSIAFDLRIIDSPEIKIIDGSFSWETSTYTAYKQELAQSKLFITGTFKVGGVETNNVTMVVLASASNPNFEIGEDLIYNVSGYRNVEGQLVANSYLLNLNSSGTNGEYDLEFIGGNSYTAKIQFVGDSCEIEANETYFVATNAEDTTVDDIYLLTAPYELKNGDEIERNNELVWREIYKLDGVTPVEKYSIVVYVTNNGEDALSKFNSYELVVSSSNQVTYNSLNYIVFNISEIIEDINNSSLLDKTMHIKVSAIGKDWELGLGGEKILSSMFSDYIEVAFPETPTSLQYNGMGKITWTNKTSGSVMIEIVYEQTQYSTMTDEQYLEYNHYSSIERTVVSSNKFKDVIKVTGQVASESGYYYIKYLTNNIISINAYAVSATGYSSEETYANLNNINKYALFSAGDGSASSPYEITNYVQLQNINYYMASNFKLISSSGEIDVTSVMSNPNNYWTALGQKTDASSTMFTGKIDGNNILLKGLIVKVNNNFAGFVGNNYGQITNLKIQYNNSSIILSSTNDLIFGGISANNLGTISNCLVSGEVNFSVPNSNSTLRAGGIAGNNGANNAGNNNLINISNCLSTLNLIYSDSSTSCPAFIGGIVSYNYAIIDSCGASGNITATSLGGISAYNSGTILKSYYKLGTLTQDSRSKNLSGSVGGISGSLQASGEIKQCYSLAKIVVKNTASGITINVGGIVGQVSNQAKINYCYVSVLSFNIESTYGEVKFGNVVGIGANTTGTKVYYIAYSTAYANPASNGVLLNCECIAYTATYSGEDLINSLNLGGEAFKYGTGNGNGYNYPELIWE